MNQDRVITQTDRDSGLDPETSNYVQEPIENLRDSLRRSEVREDADYAGRTVGSSLGGVLGGIAGTAMTRHRATAVVLGVVVLGAAGSILALRVVPRTLGPVWAWAAVGSLVASGGIIASAAVIHALRDPKFGGMS